MTSGDDTVTNGPPRLALALAGLGPVLFAAINVWTSVHDRPDLSTPGRLWEPITWEVSSAVATLVLIPLIWRAVLELDGARARPFATAMRILAHAAAFYVLHVASFILLRWIVYALGGGRYVFGGVEAWLYELPKDLVTFLVTCAILLTGRKLAERPIVGNPASPELDAVRIKDGNRTFIVAAQEILAASASGNYVEFHLVDGRRPLSRSRFAEVQELLAPRGFLRTHRSWLVNRTHVREVRSLGNGDYELMVVGDLRVPVSRRSASEVLPLIG